MWEEADYGEFEPGGLYYRYGQINGTPALTWLSYCDIISETDFNSHMPTLVTDFSDNQYPLYYRLAYEQHFSETSSEIYHRVITADANNQISIADASNVSSGAGFTKNTKPSMIAASDYYGTGSRLCWIGYRQGEIFIDPEDPIGMGKVAEGGESYEQKVVFMDPGYRNHYWNFGSEVQSTQINKSNACYSIGWGISDSYPIQFADSYTLSNIYTINDLFGKEMQMCNGTTRTTMRIMAFNTSTSPYNFNS